jgi:hypothetical protein
MFAFREKPLGFGFKIGGIVVLVGKAGQAHPGLTKNEKKYKDYPGQNHADNQAQHEYLFHIIRLVIFHKAFQLDIYKNRAKCCFARYSPSMFFFGKILKFGEYPSPGPRIRPASP